jgi:ABC-type sugar transport system substrate-binding protein
MKVSHRITRLVLIGLAVLALAAPAASARPAPADRVDTGAPFVLDPAPPVVQSVDDGFDWASAAIGAGIAGGIILLIGWGGVTYRHRHEPAGLAH